MRKFTLTVIGPYKLPGPGVLVILGPTDGWPDVIIVGFLGLVDPSVWTRQLAVHYHPAPTSLRSAVGAVQTQVQTQDSGWIQGALA